MKGILNPNDFKDILEFHSSCSPTFEDFPIQQNGIDLRVCIVREYDTGVARFAFKPNGDESILHGSKNTLIHNPLKLIRGCAYELVFHLKLKEPLPEGVCAMIIGRSSFNRNGILIRSSLYDSGYIGELGATLYSFRRIEVERYFRMAQVVFISADTAKMYDGQYGEKEKQVQIIEHLIGDSNNSPPVVITSTAKESTPPIHVETVTSEKAFEGLEIDETDLEDEIEMDDNEDYADVMNNEIPSDEEDDEDFDEDFVIEEEDLDDEEDD